MKMFKSFFCPLVALALAFIILNMPVNGQISTPCTPAMISSFAPCLNFLTNSTSNGTAPTPTSACCSSLSSLTNNGLGCACLIVTGNVPVQIPINRTLAISLPRACNMPGIPLQCKATGAPAPAPGSIALGPTFSPKSSPVPAMSPEAPSTPEATSPSLAPEANTTPLLTPPSTTTDSGAPTSGTGVRPVDDTPSAAGPSQDFSPALLLLALGSVVFKYY